MQKMIWAGLLAICFGVNPSYAERWSQDEKKSLLMASDYLNTIKTAQARFTQIADDGSYAEGNLYIDRPGKARFDYDSGKLSLIADGMWFAIWDKELEYVNRLPLWDSPMAVLLEENVDLITPHKHLSIKSVVHTRGVIRITIYDRDAPELGELMLIFEDQPMILRQWVTIDATGQTTTVSLSKLEIGVELKHGLFRVPNI